MTVELKALSFEEVAEIILRSEKMSAGEHRSDIEALYSNGEFWRNKVAGVEEDQAEYRRGRREAFIYAMKLMCNHCKDEITPEFVDQVNTWFHRDEKGTVWHCFADKLRKQFEREGFRE